MMIDSNTAMIAANDMGWGGNLSWAVVTQAAKLAQQKGFERFQILSNEDSARSGYVPIAGSSTTTGYASCSGGFCSGTASTYSTPGYLMPYTISKKNVVVHFLKPGETPDPNGSTVYETASVLSGIH